jgi:RNA recognition motif-containing protein
MLSGGSPSEAARLAEGSDWKPSGERPRTYTLYVTNISFDLTEEVFRRRFSSYGPITSVYIPTLNGRSKGFGFVEFEQRADAQRAMEELNDQLWDNRKLSIQFSHSQGARLHGDHVRRDRYDRYDDRDRRDRYDRYDNRDRRDRYDDRDRRSRDDRDRRSRGRDRDYRYESSRRRPRESDSDDYSPPPRRRRTSRRSDSD